MEKAPKQGDVATSDELRRAEYETERLYGDIINLPRFEPRNHIRMPAENRAAQFSPFAALTGYEDAVAETARVTDDRIYLDSDRQGEIDAAVAELEGQLNGVHGNWKTGIAGIRTRLSYFVPDERKDGGEYLSVDVQVKRIDPLNRELVLSDGARISIGNITGIAIAE